MRAPFLVDILTPYNVIAKEALAVSLLIPTVRGQINVLPTHTHIVSQLTTGQLSLFGGANDPDRHFSITHGICKVLKERVIILSGRSEEAHEIDYDRARLALENAQNVLVSEKSLTDEEIEKYRRKVDRARLRMQLAEFIRKR